MLFRGFHPIVIPKIPISQNILSISDREGNTGRRVIASRKVEKKCQRKKKTSKMYDENKNCCNKYIASTQCANCIDFKYEASSDIFRFERSIVYEIYIYAIFIEITFEGKYSFIKPTTRSMDRDFFQLAQHLSDAGSSGAVFLRSAQRVACTGCVTCQKMQTSTMVRG